MLGVYARDSRVLDYEVIIHGPQVNFPIPAVR